MLRTSAAWTTAVVDFASGPSLELTAANEDGTIVWAENAFSTKVDWNRVVRVRAVPWTEEDEKALWDSPLSRSNREREERLRRAREAGIPACARCVSSEVARSQTDAGFYCTGCGAPVPLDATLSRAPARSA